MSPHTAGGVRLLTVSDLARLAAVPVGTVYRWNSDGTGPAYVRVGRHVRYRPADVEAWLDQHTITPSTPPGGPS